MNLTANTKLKDLLDTYPWLIDEAVKLDGKFRVLRSPLARGLIAKADLSEVGRRTGTDAETVIGKIEEMIRNHEG